MTKQLALSLVAGLLIALPGCGCKDKCCPCPSETQKTETSVDAACTDEACNTCETKTAETEQAPAKF